MKGRKRMSEESQPNVREVKTRSESKDTSLLSDEQLLALTHLLETKTNLFVTGCGGTGKSFLQKVLVDEFQSKKWITAVTASTGVVACHNGGQTLHSFFGLGIDTNRKRILSRFMSPMNKQRRKELEALDVLLLDEVSMVDPMLLDIVDDLLRAVRKTDRPFGGVLFVVFGDFAQLPPVNPVRYTYAFQHPKWSVWFPHTLSLTRSFRQTDAEFVAFLNRVRLGNMSPDDWKLLRTRALSATASSSSSSENKDITHMFATNRDVDGINSEAMSKLVSSKTPVRSFVVQKLFVANTGIVREVNPPVERVPNRIEAFFTNMEKNCLARSRVDLVQGALVMLLANVDREFRVANGSRGRVVSFEESGSPTVEFDNGLVMTIEPHEWRFDAGGQGSAIWKQIPLRACWAMTIHKSQGMTIDGRGIVDLSGCRSDGQGYVALSRFRTLENVHLCGVDDRSIRVNEHVCKYYERLSSSRSSLSESQKWN